MDKYKTSIFWFRRDLRLHDNHALFQALTTSKNVLVVFIFDPNILTFLNENDRRISLLFDRLQELNKELSSYGSRINILHGDPKDVFSDLHSKYNIDAVFANTDYEPFARKRDSAIARLCGKMGSSFRLLKDQVIFEKNEILNGAGKPYAVYTHYMRNWMSKFRISLTSPYLSQDFLHKIITSDKLLQVESVEQLGFEYQEIELKEPSLDHETLRFYDETRNSIEKDGTTHMSVHLRFGFLSIREVAKLAYQYSESLLKELVWRSFFSQLIWHNPYVVDKCFKPKYEKVTWSKDKHLFMKWMYGKTGFPLVDAGMRELFDTGLMNNRVRMLTASFLVKNLGVDWRIGEAYFASKLLDFDQASNNGNWQWVAGTGADSAPYFRVFNPITQQEKFDPNFIYCKKWLHEMDELGNYAMPKITDLKTSRLEAIKRYKAIDL
jgi:deoxyribodipyrimidine photo-lyase